MSDLVATNSTADNRPAQRIAIGVEYNGSQFHGWQRQAQPAVATVQAALENAIAKVANHPVTLVCAGRTDAGVHATGQVAHFDSFEPREQKAWVMGVNSLLPGSVRVLWAHAVEQDFHARFSATARRYQYWIDNTAVRSGIFDGLLTHCPTPHGQQLDVASMHSAAQALPGEQDFTSFRAVACESSTPMRNVHRVSVTGYAVASGQRICIDIEANAFLLHMVRNITGSLLEVGAGRESAEWIAELLQKRDRTQAAATARPDGLYLVHVSYPAGFGLPQALNAPFAVG